VPGTIYSQLYIAAAFSLSCHSLLNYFNHRLYELDSEDLKVVSVNHPPYTIPSMRLEFLQVVNVASIFMCLLKRVVCIEDFAAQASGV